MVHHEFEGFTGGPFVGRESTDFRSIETTGYDQRDCAFGARIRSKQAHTDALCRLYDSPTNSWLLTGSMNQARAVHTATLLQNGQVLAAGGRVKTPNGTFSVLASAELYTP